MHTDGEKVVSIAPEDDSDLWLDDEENTDVETMAKKECASKLEVPDRFHCGILDSIRGNMAREDWI